MTYLEVLALEKRRTVPMRATARADREDGGHGRHVGVLFLATPEECYLWELMGAAEQIAPDFGAES